ncbi:MAG: FHA domain-containing protein [Nitrospirae bacterium]|nr:MAG: FHA domain-containing protein [Nitrospirota bacterium]
MPFTIIAKERLGPAGEKITTTQLSGTTLRIGRGTDNDLHLNDHSVQYHHAVIQQEDAGYVLRDLNVLSLTSVNDMPVKEMVLPEAGTIRIGPYTFRFAGPTATSPFTIEYDLTGLSPEASPETPAPIPAGSEATTRDEKFRLVAAYKLQGRYLTKTTIAVLAVFMVLGGSALVYALGKHLIFMPGTISVKHRLFANDCARCHAAWKPIFTVVPDKTCLSCHSGPPHFSERAFGPAPQCAGCHAEHKGRAVLAALPDSTCIQCHGDLKVKDARIPIAPTVHSFMDDHPEFAITVSPLGQHPAQRARLNDAERVADTAAIKLDHKLHLKSNLMGPGGPEQLSCASCHQADPQGAYMRPVTYEKDCMRCHLLDFDERLPGKTIPHGQTPEEVDRFLRATYAEYYLLQHQPELKPSGTTRRLPGAPRPKEEIRINGMVEEAERLLVGPPGSKTKKGKCVLCHMVEHTGIASQSDLHKLPMIVKTAMPERWLPYSYFDHKAHLMLQCVACHEAAPRSERTRDVLLPNIASCRNCHFEPGGARTQCLTCHAYHDKSQEAQKRTDQGYSIEQFREAH